MTASFDARARRLFGRAVLAAAVSAACLARPAVAQVPTPAVEGPIPGDAPGSAGHNYPFLASDKPLASFNYVEQEFFMSGTAAIYGNLAVPPGTGSAAVQAPLGLMSGYAPYRTNIIVRRPASDAGFNGTVIVEWANVTSGYNTTPDWTQSADYFLRAGYAYAEVSAQNNGISASPNGLKAWSPARYGALDVTDGGALAADELSFSIFSQAGQAIRANAGGIMGGLAIKHVIAAGTSQSAGWLSVYLNGVQPFDKLYDAALLRIGGELVSSGLNIPVIKLLSESEFLNPSTDNEIPVLQPDRDGTGAHGAGGLRTWPVAGTSHGDYHNASQRRAVSLRDLGIDPTVVNCGAPAYSRIPFHRVIDAAYARLVRWLDTGVAPPHAPNFVVTSATPPDATADSFGTNIARDGEGNALGAIRLPEHAVPVATNTGTNFGPGLCFLNGTFLPFDAATLSRLYPTRQDYLAKFVAAAFAAYRQGFLLSKDLEESVVAAAGASIP